MASSRGAVPLPVPVTHWCCPKCSRTHRTQLAKAHTPFHPCVGLGGITAPYVPVGTRARLVAVERGDYVGTEKGVAHDTDGRAVMAVETHYPDGRNDCAVLAPIATGTIERA